MTVQPDRNEQYYAVRRATRRAVLDLAKDAGIAPVFRPADLSRPAGADLSPLAGMNLSRRVELASRNLARDYLRAAREAGFTWHEIGMAMRQVPLADARASEGTPADVAFSYAAGPSNTDHARRHGRAVVWHCGSCDRSISDRGMASGPADDERGHAEGCSRLAATIAAETAKWASFDADWEAGQ